MKFELDGQPSDLARPERPSVKRIREFLAAIEDGKLLSTSTLCQRTKTGESTFGAFRKSFPENRVAVGRVIYWGNARTVAAAKERLNER